MISPKLSKISKTENVKPVKRMKVNLQGKLKFICVLLILSDKPQVKLFFCKNESELNQIVSKISFYLNEISPIIIRNRF